MLRFISAIVVNKPRSTAMWNIKVLLVTVAFIIEIPYHMGEYAKLNLRGSIL